MGCWDVYCLFCGAPPTSIDDIEELFDEPDRYRKAIQTYKNTSAWLGACTLLLLNNDVIRGCYETNCNISFVDPKIQKEYECMSDYRAKNYLNNIQWGYFVHDDCYDYACAKTKITIKAQHIPIKFQEDKAINHGKIEQYWDQLTDYNSMAEDGNMWMLMSPLVSAKNASRINGILSQFKFKPNRTGPSVSASFYSNGDIKYGNNHKFWIKKNNKWMPYNEKVITKKFKLPITKKLVELNISNKTRNKYKQYLFNLPELYYHNSKGLMFLTNFSYTNTGLNITIMGSEKKIQELEKLANLLTKKNNK